MKEERASCHKKKKKKRGGGCVQPVYGGDQDKLI